MDAVERLIYFHSKEIIINNRRKKNNKPWTGCDLLVWECAKKFCIRTHYGANTMCGEVYAYVRRYHIGKHLTWNIYTSPQSGHHKTWCLLDRHNSNLHGKPGCWNTVKWNEGKQLGLHQIVNLVLCCSCFLLPDMIATDGCSLGVMHGIGERKLLCDDFHNSKNTNMHDWQLFGFKAKKITLRTIRNADRKFV